MHLFRNNQSSPQPPRPPQNNFWSRIRGIFGWIINLITNQGIANFSQSLPIFTTIFIIFTGITSLLLNLTMSNVSISIPSRIDSEVKIEMKSDPNNLCQDPIIKKQFLLKELRKSNNESDKLKIENTTNKIKGDNTINSLLNNGKSSLTKEFITRLEKDEPDLFDQKNLDKWTGELYYNKDLTDIYPVFRWECRYQSSNRSEGPPNPLTIGFNLDDYCKEKFSGKELLKATHHNKNDQNSLYCVKPHHENSRH